MESMPQSVLFVILLLFAITSTTAYDGITYTAVPSDVKNHIEGRCVGAVDDADLTALVPRGLWPEEGSADDCILVNMTCLQGLDSCNVNNLATVIVVGAVTDKTRGDVKDDGNTVLLSKVVFEALAADSSASRITISYTPVKH